LRAAVGGDQQSETRDSLLAVYLRWFVDIFAANYKEDGQLDNATAAAREALRLKPNDLDALLILVDAYQSAGRNARTNGVAEEIPAISPDFSVERWATTQPHKAPSALNRIVDSLLAAGLPK
jgi:tetratricopeptide (TPR) repeat protein